MPQSRFGFRLTFVEIYAAMRLSIVVLFILAGLVACKPKTRGPEQPKESYIKTASQTDEMSMISVPFSFEAKSIESLLNTKLNGVVYEDNDIKDDDMMVKATKVKPIRFAMDGQAFNYTVPIKVWIRRALPVGSVEGEGEISMSFTTRYQIREDWTFKTVTTISGYEWLKTPVLKAGFMEFSVKLLADQILKRMQSQLTTPIDQQFAQLVDIKTSMKDTWAQMQNPMLLDSAYRMWLKMTPQQVTMAPLKNTAGRINGLIQIGTFLDVTFGDRPLFRANSLLPNLKWQAVEPGADTFSMHILTDVPFEEAERLANRFMRGYTYTQGKRKVTVNNIKLFGQEDKMVVETGLSGSFNGNIYLVGKPVYEPAKNAIIMRDVDFDVNTRNYLLKSASWLFDKVLVNKVAQSMVFPLDQNINTIKTDMNKQLSNYSVAPGVWLNGQVKDIHIEEVFIKPGGIWVKIFSSGRLMVDIKDFGL
jgi:hypothetical protein